MLAPRAADNLIAVAYVNSVAGQDELVFDGASVAFDAEGRLIARGPQFREDLVVVDIDLDEVAQRRLHDPRRRAELRDREGEVDVEHIDLGFRLPHPDGPLSRPVAPLLGDEEEVWEALVLGTRDYLAKTGFKEALIAV